MSRSVPRLHIAMCDRRLGSEPAVELRTAEDHYNYGVALINTRKVAEARDSPGKGAGDRSRLGPHSLRPGAGSGPVRRSGQRPREPASAPSSWNRAIALIARQDADFAPFANQPAFQALSYPEKKTVVSASRVPHGSASLGSSPSGGGTGLSVRPARTEALHPSGGRLRHPPRWRSPPSSPSPTTAAARGRLRREFDVLPPGDIRNCMVALSEDSTLLSRLFQYRFETGRGLKGHSFGNLFLMALTHLMGDFPDAVKASGEVLKIAGRIYPSTAANVSLEATLADGTRCMGETRISRSRLRSASVRLKPRERAPARRDAHGHRRGRRDHARPGFAVHQRDPQPAGGRHSGGHPQLARAQVLLRQPHVAARRDHRASAPAITSAPSTATPAANCSITPWSTSAPSPARSRSATPARRACPWRTISTRC